MPSVTGARLVDKRAQDDGQALKAVRVRAEQLADNRLIDAAPGERASADGMKGIGLPTPESTLAELGIGQCIAPVARTS